MFTLIDAIMKVFEKLCQFIYTHTSSIRVPVAPHSYQQLTLSIKSIYMASFSGILLDPFYSWFSVVVSSS